MRTERGFDRLVNFSDAVVAIALTLLILPLVDIARQAPKGESIGHVLSSHGYELFAFALSFVVIGVLWRAHHSLFEHLQGYNEAILRANQIWLFTIIVLPFVTELLNRTHASRLANGLYVGTLLTSSTCLTAITLIIRRNAGLRHPGSAASPQSRIDTPPYVTSALFAVALVIVIAVPSANMWPLLVLFLGDPIRRLTARFSGRASTSPDSATPAER